MIRSVVIWPAPILSKPTRPIQTFDADLHQLLADLAESMVEAKGIGIAANQVGVNLRVALVGRGDGTFVEMVNPRIVARRGTVDRMEGCLSVPGEEEVVKRAAEVEVEFQDRHGTPCRETATERYAHVVQHEVDHLDGVVYVNHLSHLKRDIIRRKMIKQKE